MRFGIKKRLLAILTNSNGVQGWVTRDWITVEVKHGVQILEAGAVRFSEITAIKDDFDFVMFGESFGSSSGEFAADFCGPQIGPLIFVVNQSAQALFTVRADAGLWGFLPLTAAPDGLGALTWRSGRCGWCHCRGCR